MANKKKGKDAVEGEGFLSKLGTFLLVIMIIIVWLAIFALMIKLDIGGLGSRLRPLLKDVPYVRLILPGVSDDVLIRENNYPYADITEAVARIDELEKKESELEQTNQSYARKIAELQLEVDRLRVFEEDQAAFAERVKRFDYNVVYNDKAPEKEEYYKYYNEINPETAAEIYRQVVEQLQYDDSIKQKAAYLKTMKPGNAAKVVEEMTADLEYTCKVLQCMKTDEVAAILDKTDTLFAARIFQKMHDMDEEWYDKIQNNLLKYQQ